MPSKNDAPLPSTSDRAPQQQVIYGVIRHIERLQQQSDEMWIRQLSASDRSKLMSIGMVVMIILPMTAVLLLLASVTGTVDVALLYVPMLVTDAFLLMLGQLLRLMTKFPRVRNVASMVATAIAIVCLCFLVVPMMNQGFKTVRSLHGDTSYVTGTSLSVNHSVVGVIVLLVAFVATMLAAFTVLQCYGLRMDDTRPPYLVIEHANAYRQRLS